jgi:hypothetical protein
MKRIFLLQNEMANREEFLKTVSKLTLIPVKELEQIEQNEQVCFSEHYAYNIMRLYGYTDIDNFIQEIDDVSDKLVDEYNVSLFDYKVLL